MKNFRITNGDLVLGVNGRLDMVRGSDKLGQDLTLWTLEPIGIGFTTPSFGSILDSYDGEGSHRFIGHNIDEAIVSRIKAEVERIVGLYQQNQMEGVKLAQMNGELSLYQRSEILNEIISIRAFVSDRDPTAVGVEVKIRTAAGDTVSLFTQIDDEGVRIV